MCGVACGAGHNAKPKANQHAEPSPSPHTNPCMSKPIPSPPKVPLACPSLFAAPWRPTPGPPTSPKPASHSCITKSHTLHVQVHVQVHPFITKSPTPACPSTYPSRPFTNRNPTCLSKPLITKSPRHASQSMLLGRPSCKRNLGGQRKFLQVPATARPWSALSWRVLSLATCHKYLHTDCQRCPLKRQSNHNQANYGCLEAPSYTQTHKLCPKYNIQPDILTTDVRQPLQALRFQGPRHRKSPHLQASHVCMFMAGFVVESPPMQF